MNVKGLALGAVGMGLVLPAMLWAQQIQVNYKDKANNFVLSGFGPWGLRKVSDEVISFSGEGKPAVGVSLSQKLRVEALAWTGTAKRSAPRTMELVEATWTGDVHIVANRDEGKVEINAPKARFKGALRRFDLEGGFVIVQTLVDGTMTLTAKSGYVVLFETKPVDTPTLIASAAASGAVRVVVSTQAKGKPAPTVLTADAARAVYDAKARTLTLTGGVKLTGDDSSVLGDAMGQNAVLTLDAQGKPIAFEMDGDPGVSHYTERKKKGGR